MKPKHVFLVIAVVLGLVLVAAGWKLSTMNSAPSQPEEGQETPETPEEPLAATAMVPCEEQIDADVTIQNAVGGVLYQHAVSVDGEVVLSIDTLTWKPGVVPLQFPESAVSLYRQTDCYAYVEVSPLGLGGNVLYGGPAGLYRIDLRDQTSVEIPLDGFLSDISPDETKVVTVDQGMVLDVTVLDLQTGDKRAFLLPSPYNDAGSAMFSPDGTEIAYGAVQRDLQNNSEVVKQAVIVIDLRTGEQTVSAAEGVRAGFPVYVKGWTKGNQPVVSDTL